MALLEILLDDHARLIQDEAAWIRHPAVMLAHLEAIVRVLLVKMLVEQTELTDDALPTSERSVYVMPRFAVKVDSTSTGS